MVINVSSGDRIIGTIDPVRLAGLYLWVHNPDGGHTKFKWGFDSHGVPVVLADGLCPSLLPGFRRVGVCST